MCQFRCRRPPLASWTCCHCSLAHLPNDTLAKYEHAPSFYSVGWSLGKEKLEGKPDYSKVRPGYGFFCVGPAVGCGGGCTRRLVLS